MCPFAAWTILKQIFPNVNLYRDRSFSLRKAISRKLCTSAPEERFKSFVPFNEMMERRRDEAGRSVVVQIKSKKSYDDLLTYCLKFGSVRNAFYYSLDHQSNFVIVEYDNYDSSQAAIKYASTSCSRDVVPVTSPFLWLRADLKQEPPRKDLPPLSVENNGLPSLEELQNDLTLSSSFSDDIIMLYHRLKLTETGCRLRYLTALQVETALRGMFVNGRVLPFGSTTNGFGKVNCDLDLILEFNLLDSIPETSRLRTHAKPMDREKNQRHLEILADIIQYFLPGCNSIRRILRARVPIVKYRHDLTGVECDLSASNLSGVFMSEWLYLCSSYDTRVCPLVFAVRFWARELNLTNPNPGKWITNFSLTLLVLFFFQSEKIIPSLDTLNGLKRPQDVKMVVEEDCGFLSDLRLLPLSETKLIDDDLLTLLLKFFKFYSSFDSRSYALSLNSGSLIPKPVYEPLYIVNPLEKGLNVSRNVSPEECERFKLECRNASWIIECSINARSNSENKWGFLDLVRSQTLNRDHFQNPRIGMKGKTRFAVKDLFQDTEAG